MPGRRRAEGRAPGYTRPQPGPPPRPQSQPATHRTMALSCACMHAPHWRSSWLRMRPAQHALRVSAVERPRTSAHASAPSMRRRSVGALPACLALRVYLASVVVRTRPTRTSRTWTRTCVWDLSAQRCRAQRPLRTSAAGAACALRTARSRRHTPPVQFRIVCTL
jgi:hypothetical protein